MRSKPLCDLLQSVSAQSLYPNEILIIDGSIDTQTKVSLKTYNFKNLHYFLVDDKDRGLTKQRNYGIQNVNKKSDIVCFLDDDTILTPEYFEQLIGTYKTNPMALGVGGYITNEVKWEQSDRKNNPNKFYYDGMMRNEPSRFKMRRKFGLLPDTPPGYLPTFSHGRSISFLPPSGKTYEVEQLMGGVSSFKRSVFLDQKFSTFFEGYGLYEDADFTLRLSKKGKLYLNTKAELCHYHDPSGRPNLFKYGKMVLKNGWYVWRVKYPNPTTKAHIKWHATALLLIAIRSINIITSDKKKEALTETIGRTFGWFSLLLKKPVIES